MQAYKFETRISKTGKISLPIQNQLYNKEVEIFIIPKKAQAKTSSMNPMEFINKWSGFFSNQNTDDLKYQYLTEKHK